MQKARRQSEDLRPLVGKRFQVLFHSLVQGAFHLSLTVLVRYRSLRSIQPYQMVLANSRRISPVPRYSGYYQVYLTIHVRDYHPVSYCFPEQFPFLINKPYCSPITPMQPKSHWFGLFPFRSPLLRESLLFSFPPGTQMFQFPGLAFFRIICLQHIGLPHSEIFGYNGCLHLTEAYRSLPRLSSPLRAKASAVCP